MENNNKLIPIENMKDIFMYENNLYKLEFNNIIKSSCGDCLKCDLRAACTQMKFNLPEICPEYRYFRKINISPTLDNKCNTCENYKPKFEDHLPNTIEDVKKIIWCKDVDEEKLTLMTNLIKARDIYRQGWKPDWEDSHLDKYAISNHLKCYKKLTQLMVIQIISKYEFIFSFQTKEIAQRFLDNFENELKEFYEIN